MVENNQKINFRIREQLNLYLMKKIHRIINTGLCLGCGLCEAIAGRDKCEMILTPKGFYQPKFKTTLDPTEVTQILKCCPGIRVTGNKHSGVWGNVLSVSETWATDETLRKKSATGGVISSLAIYLLESKKVDAILQVGVKKDSWLYNELLISRTKEEVFINAQSRYAPALVFDRIKTILDSSEETFGFIGKPCDIAGIKNFIKYNPQYNNRIKYTLAIFCAGIPSYNATKTLIEEAKMTETPYSIKYRGDGWPGEFEAKWKNGKSLKVSYNDSWGKVLGRTLGIRCKICPDGIGMLADISTGDSWNTKDGYPDFTEADGKNFCFIRTQNGQELYQNAAEAGVIQTQAYNMDIIKDIHQYQYNRRIFAAWRILAIQIATNRLLKFEGLGLKQIMLKKNLLYGIKEFLGALARLKKQNKESN